MEENKSTYHWLVILAVWRNRFTFKINCSTSTLEVDMCCSDSSVHDIYVDALTSEIEKLLDHDLSLFMILIIRREVFHSPLQLRSLE